MDIVFNFVLFDNGEKKVARYQQFFAIKKSMQRIKHVENGKRNVSVDTLEKLVCNGLEISFKDFFSADLFNDKKKKV